MNTKHITSKTIVLIHGLFVNPKSWSDWKAFFEAKGYTVHTPANPSHAGEPRDLWKNVDPKLGKVSFEDVVMNIANFIDTLPEKPILIGHSLGGLTVQKLLEMGKGVAGVTIDGAAPAGIVTTKWSFWKSNFTVINYFKGNAPFLPTKEWFHYTFGNNLSKAASDKVFDDIVVPESRNIARSTLSGFGKIDMKKAHAPLLFIAGGKDNIIPASLNRKNFQAYTDKNSVTEYREFANRSHFTCGEEGWEEVANFVADWLK
jgi:pimeloyl-ACP methyl ester carboxylesterase